MLGRTPNIRHFVAQLSIVAIYALLIGLMYYFQWKSSSFRWAFNESHSSFHRTFGEPAFWEFSESFLRDFEEHAFGELTKSFRGVFREPVLLKFSESFLRVLRESFWSPKANQPKAGCTLSITCRVFPPSPLDEKAAESSLVDPDFVCTDFLS